MSSPDALQQLTAAALGLEQLAGVAWDEVEVTDLPAAVVELARMRTRVEAALVAVAGRVAATDAASEAGWASTKDFPTHATGGRKGAGGTLLRIAEHTADLPAVRAAHAAGAISTAQARVIGTRVSRLPRSPELREAAAARMLDLVQTEGHDATDLDRGFADVVRDLDPDGTLRDSEESKEQRERGAHQARFLSFGPDTLGGVRLTGYADAEAAEVVKATLMALAAPVSTEPGACGGDPTNLTNRTNPRGRDTAGRPSGPGCPDRGCAHDGTDPRDSGAQMLDALVEACRRLQATSDTDTLPHDHGTTARVTVTVSYEDLRRQIQDSAGRAGLADGVLGSGARISITAIRRIACDADIIPAVLGSAGQILDVGRTQRLVTTAIWLALVLRDRHCTFPGCTRPPIACDAHHIVHWADGGPTSLDNLILLCRRHHTLTHHSPWRVHLDPATRRPTWTPPPAIDDRHRYTYLPPTRPPPRVA